MAEQKVIGLDNKKKEIEEAEEIVMVRTKMGSWIGKGLYEQTGEAVVGIEEAYEMAMVNSAPGFTFFFVGEVVELGDDIVVIELSKKSLYYQEYRKAASNIQVVSAGSVPDLMKK